MPGRCPSSSPPSPAAPRTSSLGSAQSLECGRSRRATTTRTAPTRRSRRGSGLPTRPSSWRGGRPRAPSSSPPSRNRDRQTRRTRPAGRGHACSAWRASTPSTAASPPASPPRRATTRPAARTPSQSRRAETPRWWWTTGSCPRPTLVRPSLACPSASPRPSPTSASASTAAALAANSSSSLRARTSPSRPPEAGGGLHRRGGGARNDCMCMASELPFCSGSLRSLFVCSLCVCGIMIMGGFAPGSQ
mmetsp:Transcript_26244/g.83379  ORF Transcript_26244/g.83379 Transcript_26244/m.83379 type:complete len:247 (+) Transcript_26244:1452-2192(+)